ncbi:MAG: hypothetical protein DMF82_10230 [Acidobacteria bacterium]|nr:MAG: hypothetical protein DMF82_10230 [Acidobacteriota bacterium]
MSRRPARLVAVTAALLAGAPSGAVLAQRGNEPRSERFVRRVGRALYLRGNAFRIAGASNYYLMYKSRAMVDDLLDTAAASGFNVVRLWGSLEIGNQDGSNSINRKAEGVYFQYWDGGAPAYNDGPDGLQRLDYVVYKAGQLGLELIIPFVNNWNGFGGMDQYVRWRGGRYHDDFYADPVIRGWYKAWIAHLLDHRNVYTGVAYKDDPAIMTWELANEPRCKSAGAYPQSSACTTRTLIDWAGEVASFVKSIDPNHLLSVGDEGFYCSPSATDWTENCGEGVDTLALAELPGVDLLSFHLYPDGWGKSAAWGTAWIERHLQDAGRIHERAVLGEFGLLDKATRNPLYKEWTDSVLTGGGAGALYWILSGKQDDGSYYPDYDGFTVYCPSPVCTAFGNFARVMQRRAPYRFAPVADDDAAVTPFDTPATIPATANDIAYWDVALVPESVDLDPATPGQQAEYATTAGTFSLQDGGRVLFTPAPGFSGKAAASYVVSDAREQVSNAATLTVTVRPNPSAAIMLYSFETGTEGWGSASWQANAGAVEQSADYHSEGSYSLKVATADGGWFGVVLPSPVDLTGRTHFKFEVKTLATGTSQNAALQLGDGWQWCQGAWGWINPGTTTTVDMDMSNLSCSAADLSKLRAVYVWFSGGGAFYLDAVRAE